MPRVPRVLPLPDVAHRLALTWPVAWGLLLRGELLGEKRGGRWYVTTASVEQFRRHHADPPNPQPDHLVRAKSAGRAGTPDPQPEPRRVA